MTNEDKFKTEFFDNILMELIKEMESRFQILSSTSADFGFLWGSKLNVTEKSDLQKCVQDLVLKYDKDFDGPTFFKEVEFLKSAVEPFMQKPLQKSIPLDVLNVLVCNGLQGQFVNCSTALRIFLTLPVSVATNERSFSKLKIIKNYLRSCMGQERLSNLSILSIEYDYLEHMSFDKIIDEFSLSKCRKVKF